MNRPMAILLLMLLGLTTCAAGPATQPAEVRHARLLLEQLDDPDAQVRQSASLQLNSLGGEALPVVEEAATDEQTSPERRRRLQAALKILRPRAAREADARRRFEWERESFHAAYRKGGHTNPQWDDAAVRAIDLCLRLGEDPLHGPQAPREAAIAACKAAIDKGCDDPILHMLYGIAYGIVGGPGGRTNVGELIIATMKFRESSAPPQVKMRLAIDLARTGGAFEDDQLRLYPAELLPQVAALPDLPKGELDALASRFFDAQIVERAGWPVLNPFSEAWGKIAKDAAGPLIFDARAELGIAQGELAVWGGAREPAGWKTQAVRTGNAEKLLRQASQIDPADPRPPFYMLWVKLYQGPEGGGLKEFDEWFRRAVVLAPDNYQAYAVKLKYLSPQWYGNSSEMLNFGRECLKTENWRAGIPLILVQVHEQLASESADLTEYYANKDVWQDLRDAYEGHLVNFPEDLRQRCAYAKLAARCQRWDVVSRQIALIGDKPDLSVFGSQTSWDYLRKKARRLGSASSQPVAP